MKKIIVISLLCGIMTTLFSFMNVAIANQERIAKMKNQILESKYKKPVTVPPKVECSIEINPKQLNCKKYDELKTDWQSLQQEFKTTSNSIFTLHNIVNKDELNQDFDKCGCHLIELERASKLSSLLKINGLLKKLKHVHSCLFQMNHNMLNNPLIFDLVSNSMLNSIKQILHNSHDLIIKVCSFREKRLPKYKNYINKLSKGCQLLGTEPDPFKCQHQ